MNKTETQALCACTYKPGMHAPFDCVCVHDQVVYATNSYVMHRVEGLYQPGSVFKALFGCLIAYMDRALALRPHKAAGSKNMQFFHGKGSKRVAPLIITSTIATAHDPIIITTAVQGMRKA